MTKVWGIFIHPWQVDEVMAKFPMVANYQVVVTRKEYRDEMTIYIELKEEVADKIGLKRKLKGGAGGSQGEGRSGVYRERGHSGSSQKD